jgi:hypothetical protein
MSFSKISFWYQALFYFFFLVFFWWEERKEVARFHRRERKLSLVTILTTKTINFYVKWFHMMRRVQIRDFVFTLKVYKKIDLKSERFWVDFLHFWRSWIDLTKFLECFLGILGQNEFICQKNLRPFFSIHYFTNSEMTRHLLMQVTCCFFLKYWWRTTCCWSYEFFKKSI